MAAHLAEGGSAYIFHADTEGLNFRRAFKESGLPHHRRVHLGEEQPRAGPLAHISGSMSRCCYGWLPNGKHKWFSDRKQSTIWNFDKPKKSADHPDHEAHPAAGLSH